MLNFIGLVESLTEACASFSLDTFPKFGYLAPFSTKKTTTNLSGIIVLFCIKIIASTETITKIARPAKLCI